jgi:hypothetical protein
MSRTEWNMLERSSCLQTCHTERNLGSASGKCSSQWRWLELCQYDIVGYVARPLKRTIRTLEGDALLHRSGQVFGNAGVVCRKHQTGQERQSLNVE